MALESNIARSINHGSVGIILIHCAIRYGKRNFYNFTKIFIIILNYEIVKAAVGTIITYLRYIKLLHGENYMIDTNTQRRLGCWAVSLTRKIVEKTQFSLEPACSKLSVRLALASAIFTVLG